MLGVKRVQEEKVKPKEVEHDAEVLKEEFGEFAEVYAETRSEAADIAGEKADEDYWRKVAQNVEQEKGGEAPQP